MTCVPALQLQSCVHVYRGRVSVAIDTVYGLCSSMCRPKPSCVPLRVLSLQVSTVGCGHVCVWFRRVCVVQTCVCAVLQVSRIQAEVWGTTEDWPAGLSLAPQSFSKS